MKNTTCILFSDDYKSQRNPLASGRTLASVPFGGRYRLIDFTLSSLVNSGIDTIGIITKDKYGSLVDHLSSGKDWDLNRRKGGLQILTPFVKEEYIITRTRSKIDALISAKEFIEYSKCENIIIADTNLVANINYEKMIKAHEDASCDITVLYKKSKDDCEGKISLEINGNQKIVGATFFEKEFSKSFNESLSVYIIKKDVLLKLLDKSYTYGFTDIDRDFVTRNLDTLNIIGFEQKNYCAVINSINSYYKASMDLFDKNIRNELFDRENPILTRVKNSSPTVYGFTGNVINSFIADGCIINGEIENCIVFRDVVIEEGAKLKSCIIMQHTVIGKNVNLGCVITDKDVIVQENRSLSGYKSYPFVISKGTIA